MNKDGLVVLTLVLSAVAMVGVGYAANGTPPDEEWNRTFGDTEGNSRAGYVQQTDDGGYIIAGSTWSYSAARDKSDFWLVKTDSNGNEQWNRTFGGTEDNSGAWYVQHTADGGYVLAGSTTSHGSGYGDFRLVKTDCNYSRFRSQ